MTRHQDIFTRLLNRGIVEDGIVEADTIRMSLRADPVSAGTHDRGGAVDWSSYPTNVVSTAMESAVRTAMESSVRDEAIRRLAEALDVPLELIATPHYPIPDDGTSENDLMVPVLLAGAGVRPARYDLPDGFRWSDAGLFVYPGSPVEEPEVTIVWQVRVMPSELEWLNLTPLERFRWENRNARHAIEREGYVPGPMHAYRLDRGEILLEWEGHL